MFIENYRSSHFSDHYVFGTWLYTFGTQAGLISTVDKSSFSMVASCHFKFQNESLNNEKMIGTLFSERKRRTTRFLDERIMKIQTAR